MESIILLHLTNIEPKGLKIDPSWWEMSSIFRRTLPCGPMLSCSGKASRSSHIPHSNGWDDRELITNCSLGFGWHPYGIIAGFSSEFPTDREEKKNDEKRNSSLMINDYVFKCVKVSGVGWFAWRHTHIRLPADTKLVGWFSIIQNVSHSFVTSSENVVGTVSMVEEHTLRK